MNMGPMTPEEFLVSAALDPNRPDYGYLRGASEWDPEGPARHVIVRMSYREDLGGIRVPVVVADCPNFEAALAAGRLMAGHRVA